MASGNGAGSDHLTHLERLAEAPEKHHFFHALRVIEAAHPDAPRLGEARRPREDKVRLGQEAELHFPPSTVSSYEPPNADGPARLTNRFFGLFGPQGPLPLHLTDFARARLRNEHDGTFIGFANMLTHRLTTLFYRAWRSGHPAPSFDRGGNDQFEHMVASLSGYHADTMRDGDALPDLAKRHFTGVLAQGARNPAGLVSLLQAFFGASVRIEEFVPSWLTLEPDDRWELGKPAVLGQTTSIGNRVRTRGAKFRIVIGPLTLAQFKRLMPGTDAQAQLRAIVKNYLGDALDWDLNLILRKEEIPAPVLGQSVELGRTGWIGSKDFTTDAADLFLEPNSAYRL